MTSPGSSKKIQLIHDASSIFYLHPSEGPTNSLTKYLLTGDNFDIWAKAAKNALDGRNKYGFVSGDIPAPGDETSPEYNAWKSNQSTICSWIFNSVEASIQPSIVSHNNAASLWKDLTERYSVSNGPRINQLKSQYHLLRQKGLTIVAYYTKFKALWDELYGNVDATCGCTCGAAPKLRAKAAAEQVHDFVMGLDDDLYSGLRTQILSMDPFPTLTKVFSLASQEERHKSIVRLRDEHTEVMSFAAQAVPPSPAASSAPSSISCTHCGKTGHTFERCYQRIGFPPRPSRGRGGRTSRGRGGGTAGRSTYTTATAHAAQAPPSAESSTTSSSAPTVPGLTTDQVNRLLTLLDAPSSSDSLIGPQYEDSDWAG